MAQGKLRFNLPAPAPSPLVDRELGFAFVPGFRFRRPLPVRFIWNLAKLSRGDALLGTLCGVVAGLCSARIAVTIAQVVDTEGAHLARQAMIFAACWLGYAIGAVGSATFIARVQRTTLLRLRLDLSNRILRTPLPELENDRGRLLTVLIQDVNELMQGAHRLPSFITAAFTFAGCMVYLAWRSPLLTGIFLLLAAGAIACCLWPSFKLQSLLAPARATHQRGFSLLEDLRSGLKVLLQSPRRRDAFVLQHLAPATRAQGDVNTRITFWETLVARWGELYLLLGLGFIIFSIPWLGLTTFAAFGSFIFVVLFLLGPISTLASCFTQYRRVRFSLTAIEASGIDLTTPLSSPPPPAGPPPSLGTIELRDVHFRYTPDPHTDAFALGPLNLRFDRPEIVFITGGNGSGKSTLLKLLTGLYPPSAGTIQVDDQIVAFPHNTAYRERFEVVFADHHVFPALLGQEDAAIDRRANELLGAVELSRKVEVRNGHFSTTDLSTGQRKRLALVIALLSDRPIVVFDEWAADQDPHFRRLFYDQFLPQLRDRGTLVIAITHDEMYFDRADRIIHLGEGRVLEDLRPAPGPAATV